MDSNLDPETFLNFIEKKRNDGSNLDNWNMAELERVVQEFKFNSQSPKEKQIPKAQIKFQWKNAHNNQPVNHPVNPNPTPEASIHLVDISYDQRQEYDN